MRRKRWNIIVSFLMIVSMLVTLMPNTVQAEETTEAQKKITDNYGSSINLATDQNKFYGGEILTIYNNVSVSGDKTVLEEGAYTVISLPKNEFAKPDKKNISTAFDQFKSLEIKETETEYQIITTYKTLYGGFNGGTPVKVNLLQKQTANGSEHHVTQKFFDKDGKELTKENGLTIYGKGKIETFYSSGSSAQRITGKTTSSMPLSVDENYVIKPGSYKSFQPSSIYTTDSDRNDPRDRRIYITIPEGTRVKPDTGWTLEKDTGKYYKDISRDDFLKNRYGACTVELDFGGIDLSAYDSESKAKEFRVNWSIQPVVDGKPQSDIGPNTGYYYYKYYILKKEPEPVVYPASQFMSTYVYNKTIDKSYQPVSGGLKACGSWHMSSGYYSDRNLTYLSYNKALLDTQRIRYSHEVLHSYSITYGKNDSEKRELSITSSQVEVSPYVSPAELRIMVTGLSEDDTAKVKTMLKGTKAYGVKTDGSKVLLSDNVPVVSYDKYASSHTADGWKKFSGGENYSKILFEYPETLKFTGQDQLNKFCRAVWTDVVGDIKESAYTTLSEKMDKVESPVISYNIKAAQAKTEVKGKFVVKEGEEPSEKPGSCSDSTHDEFRMQYETIETQRNISVSNGSQFFVNDAVTTELAYNHNRYGNFQDASNPENVNIYYLVPDGLEPVEDPNTFTDIKVVRGYQDGYNLVIAKPKTTNVPATDGSINGSKQNNYKMSFTATNRLQVGSYKIYAAMSIDNNKIGVDETGQQYGILQKNTPGGVWQNILKDADNRPDDKTKFTDFSSASFTLYPPKVLSSFKQVKLASEPDSKYSSSLGNKATIGTDIDYRWFFKNNSTKEIESLEIIDVLPYNHDKAIVPSDTGEYVDRGSTFKTPLKSVEENSKFDFYYSTDTVKGTIEENAAASWKKSVDDMSKVTMIKAVLKDGQKIAKGETVFIVTHNKIEDNDKIQDGEKAYNSFALSLNKGTSYLEALKTEVQVTYPKRDVLIEKVDQNDKEKKLYNAVFSLYEEGTGENGNDRLIKDNITTNHDGIATISDLLVGKEYYLVETSAPNKYQLSDKKIKFTVKERDKDNDVQKVTVTNDIIRTSFEITKEWIGPANVDEVTVHILANGKDTGKTAVIKKSEGWKKTVTGLPKNDDEGKAIAYTISEKKVDGYITDISGTAENGFIITNTISGKISIPVTKKWVGTPADSVTVNLYADGEKIDSQKLSGDNNWQYTFADLEQYNNGKEIEYTVEEEKVEGYDSSVTGDAETGYTFTNTKIPTTTNESSNIDPENPGSSANGKDTKTGDNTPLGLYAGIMGLSLISIILILLFGRKHKSVE